MKRRWGVAAGAVAALVMVAGCGGGADPDSQSEDQPQFTTNPSGELNAWGFDNADDVGQARLDHAASTLADVTVKLDATGFDAQKLTTRLASGDVPDVVQMDRQFVATYAAQDLILPVDACFSAWGMDPATQFYPSVTADVTYDGKLWAAPQFFQPAAIMLNQRALKAAGVDAAQIDTSKPDELVATTAGSRPGWASIRWRPGRHRCGCWVPAGASSTTRESRRSTTRPTSRPSPSSSS